MSTKQPEPKRLTLTSWGAFVRRHSVQTDPSWWQKLSREVERIADADGDWELLLQERIGGMQELLTRRRLHGAPGNWTENFTESA